MYGRDIKLDDGNKREGALLGLGRRQEHDQPREDTIAVAGRLWGGGGRKMEGGLMQDADGLKSAARCETQSHGILMSTTTCGFKLVDGGGEVHGGTRMQPGIGW